MNTLYKSFQMPKDFMDAVEVIMEYCQNEDCHEDCTNCPCTLAEIRCGDTSAYKGMTNGNVLNKIRAELMLIEGMEDAIEIIDKYRERSEE